ncbi:MAG: WYL domain-containing protein [Fusobacteriaceae bacterium]|jgi:predicted DNA-binding transcriptional regulator YafY|nr:WYL domain-containing protein [Fusobacteriaceae bacterium]
MSKGSNQKHKILVILKLLREKTDENHCIKTNDILHELQQNGIDAERKSIYDDISVLQEFGYNIITERGPSGGYRLVDRHFELAELKILVDAIQASKFISSKKSKELIAKISNMTSSNEAKQLERNVYINDRIKTMNTSIYYNVDRLHSAILNQKQISFKYWEWTIQKEQKEKRNGKYYEISPWSLVWSNDCYYLIGYEEGTQLIKHYRVDKMRTIKVLEKSRCGKDDFKNFNLVSYMKKTFNMYGGDDKNVSIRFPNSKISPVIDKFGTDVPIKRDGKDNFILKVEISISNQFFGWLSGLGEGIQILGPSDLVDDYIGFLKNIESNYLG